MSKVTRATALYDAVLMLATPSEQTIIRAGEPREHLDMSRLGMGPTDADLASDAYAAIKGVIQRIGADPGLRITALDQRLGHAQRSPVEVEQVVRGRLTWSGPGGIDCTLRLEWASPAIVLASLMVEPVHKAPTAPIAMSRSSRLAAGERIDDMERLQRMQELIDEGRPPKTAARLAARELPHPRTTEESTTKRLTRKFAKLSKAKEQ
jgi:hypothetical protein